MGFFVNTSILRIELYEKGAQSQFTKMREKEASTNGMKSFLMEYCSFTTSFWICVWVTH